jgi:hypothetical protein
VADRKRSKPLVGVAAPQVSTEQVPPGGASDSHRHTYESLLGKPVGGAAAPFGASGPGHSQGLVPDPGAVAGNTKFLREDAVFAVPAGGGGGVTTYNGRAGAVVPVVGDAVLDINAHVALADPHTQYALDSDLAAHVAAADPHVQYQKESEKDAASGYAGLDATTKVPIAEIPTGVTGVTVPFGNDARFSDARTPTAHAASHGAAGGDPVTLTEAQITNLVADLAAKLGNLASFFPAYTADGVFDAVNALPAIFSSLGSGKLRFGYHDGGSAQYLPSLGFAASSVDYIASLLVLQCRIFSGVAEAYNRFQLQHGGTHEWGSGAALPDTNLYRSAANKLRTDDALDVALTLDVGGDTTIGGTITAAAARGLLGVLDANYAPGSVAMLDKQFLLHYKRLELAGTERLTVPGTSNVVLTDMRTDQGNKATRILGNPKILDASFTIPNDYTHTQRNRLTLPRDARATLLGTADLFLTDDFDSRSRVVLAGRG